MPTAGFTQHFLKRAWPFPTFKCFSVNLWISVTCVRARKVLAVLFVTENHQRPLRVLRGEMMLE